jgi:glucuronoarabinoxylan endo-1,4-beta-xylanase
MTDSKLTIRVDEATTYQTIDGFGFSAAFQRADIIRGSRGLRAAQRSEVLDLLLGEAGASLSILRLGIGSSTDWVYDRMKSIAPTPPADVDTPPSYEWDGSDGGQVWLARRAQEYGVRLFYATAWSAPGYMLSDGHDTGGGVLGGLPGSPRHLGDWRAAYARYLIEYVRLYRREGIAITHVGFTNEPDLFDHKEPHEIPYAAMRMTPAQVTDFAKVLGPEIERSGLPVSLVCCDATSWDKQVVYSAAIESDPEARRLVAVHAGHNYMVPARRRLPTDRPSWMSEWEPDVEGHHWRTGWDTGAPDDGLRLAEDIHGALTQANVSAYIYWFGASIGGTRALIRLDGPRYHVAKRLWALAAFSRYVRPDAVRVAASSSDPAVKVSAFVNAAGPTVLTLINTGNRPLTAEIDHVRRPASKEATAYVTNDTMSMTRTAALSWPEAHPTADVPPRSVTCLVGL